MSKVVLDKVDPIDEEVKEQYIAFKEDVTRQALEFLRDKIPRKILHFNELVRESSSKGSLYNCHDLDTVSYRVIPSNEERQKRRKAASEDHQEDEQMITPTHKQIYEQLQSVKNEIADLMEMMGIIRLWIQLNVPRIEDGNNFGVGIQEEVIAELNRVEEAIYATRDIVLKYYMARGKLWSKVIKYPNINDYSEAIRELDEKQWVQIRFINSEMRNNYSTIYDLICKNWQKIVKPKSEDGSYRMTF